MVYWQEFSELGQETSKFLYFRAEKKKQGFGIPSMYWSRELPVLRDLLHDKISSFGNRGVFQKSYLNAMIDSVISNRKATTADVQLVSSAWDVMMLEMWLNSREIT